MTETTVAKRNGLELTVSHHPDGDPAFLNRVTVKPVDQPSPVHWLIFSVCVWDGKMRFNLANHHGPLEMLAALQLICDYEGEVLDAGKTLWKHT